MSDLTPLSILAGFSVDPDTGEPVRLIQDTMSNTQKQLAEIMTSTYPQSAIDEARRVTSLLCERCISSCVGGKRTKSGNTKGYDILGPGGIKIEAKVGRIGNAAIIKSSQLNQLESEGMYGIVFYRTNENRPPSYYTSKTGLGISSQEYLLRNVSIENLFLFPRDVMTLRYNTTPNREGVIRSTGVRHKSLSRSSALNLYNDNLSKEKQYNYSGRYKNHYFQILSLGYEI